MALWGRVLAEIIAMCLMTEYILATMQMMSLVIVKLLLFGEYARWTSRRNNELVAWHKC